ncbi:MAG: beta-lactamase family protein [Myxococcales bacterium]|nr:beta-lactamase family protein [Myxococcales bacterium]
MRVPAPTSAGDPRLVEVIAAEIVESAVATSCSVAVSVDGQRSVAVVTRDAVAQPPVFDLASVTKPLTATVALAAVARGELTLETTVAEVLPELAGTPAAGARLEELLAHRAGLPAWGALYRDESFSFTPERSTPMSGCPSLESLLLRAASRRDEGRGEVYSDLGYVLVGAMLARRLGPLREQWRVHAGIGGAPAELAAVVPTEDVAWRGGVIRGRVHDENAFVLEEAGGDPGHAGAFASAEQLVAFGESWLASLAGQGRLPASLAHEAIRPRDGGTHRLGWDGRSGPAPSSGRRFGARTFGHLGFTGTSVWIDPDQALVFVLLTNRVHPTRANDRLRAARPRVHDAVLARILP